MIKMAPREGKKKYQKPHTNSAITAVLYVATFDFGLINTQLLQDLICHCKAGGTQ